MDYQFQSQRNTLGSRLCSQMNRNLYLVPMLRKKCSEFMSYNGPAGILEYKTIKIDNVMSSSVPGIIRLVFNITVRYTRIPQ